jgi:hypothetical protein
MENKSIVLPVSSRISRSFTDGSCDLSMGIMGVYDLCAGELAELSIGVMPVLPEAPEVRSPFSIPLLKGETLQRVQ